MRQHQKTQQARVLRKNLTDAEQLLWHYIRHRQMKGFKFRRQCPIGPYICDFVCLEKMLVLEIDGGQHAGAANYDQRRDDYLKSCGYRVMRFWNHEVLLQRDAVLEVIYAYLILDTTLPPP
jgi:very-short-patch-repair endonuclease